MLLADSTSVTQENRSEFYSHVYPMQKNTRDKLVDISKEPREIIAIDCCGWHYARLFDRKIIMLETIHSVKNYKLTRQQFTKLIDDRNDKLVWPQISAVRDPMLLLDRSPILKYLTQTELLELIDSMVKVYNPSKITLRGYLQFLDDSRLVDRVLSWVPLLQIPNFVVVTFVYDTDHMIYTLCIKKCQSYL